MGTDLHLRHFIGAMCFVALACTAPAQRLDSVHVFKTLPAGRYTSASANALAWKLDREHAPYRAITGDAVATVRYQVGEARYTHADAELVADYSGLGNIQLSGLALNVGVAVRF